MTKLNVFLEQEVLNGMHNIKMITSFAAEGLVSYLNNFTKYPAPTPLTNPLD